MRKMLRVLIAAGIAGASTVAFAAGPSDKATGKIKSVDLMSHSVTFEDGKTYKIERGVSIERMKPGQTVTITYSVFGDPVIEASSAASSASD